MLVGLLSDLLIVARSLVAWSEYPTRQIHGASGGRPINNIIIADCSGLVNGRLQMWRKIFLSHL